ELPGGPSLLAGRTAILEIMRIRDDSQMRQKSPVTPLRRRMPSGATARTPPATASLLELQRAAGNQAVSRMLSGSAPAIVQSASAAAGTPVVMRDPVPEVEAPAYIEKFGSELGDGVRDFLAQQEFGLPSPFLSWMTPKSFSTAALSSAGANGGKALVVKLPE